MTSGVYQITNTVNGHAYIGSAVSIYKRWRTHRRQLTQGQHTNPRLQRAWGKYGPEAFRFTMLMECPPDQLLVNEQKYLDELQPYYNICETAGNRLGVRHTPEARAKTGQREYTTERWQGLVIVAPDGTEYTNITNLEGFARAHGLKYSNVKALADGRVRWTSGGWTANWGLQREIESAIL